jgi:hypothetical protein
MDSIAELIESEVMSWPKAEKLPQRFGGVEFRVNGHEKGESNE